MKGKPKNKVSEATEHLVCRKRRFGKPNRRESSDSIGNLARPLGIPTPILEYGIPSNIAGIRDIPDNFYNRRRI